MLKTVYLTILVTHVVLAATVPVLAIITIYRGLKGDWERHRRIAKLTFPIWLYVSVTGVIIYWMLYHLAPGN
jgi:protein SCO1/2/putative membrane protein